MPQIADGGGWRTRLVLVNPTGEVITGEFRPYAQNGQPLTLTLNGKTASVFDYSLPPSGAASFQSGGVQSGVQVGSVRVDPTMSSPTVFAMFGYSVNGIRGTGATSLANGSGGQVMSVFVESEGNLGAPGSIQSGIAVTNSGLVEPTYLHFELYQPDGTLVGMSKDISIPAHWQSAMFLSEIPGLPPIPSSFEGTLRVVSSANRFSTSGVSVTGLRARFSERDEFLSTATPPISEVFFTTSPELLFPHLAVGGDYSAEFVLFSDDGASGTVNFFDQKGNQLSLPSSAR